MKLDPGSVDVKILAPAVLALVAVSDGARLAPEAIPGATGKVRSRGVWMPFCSQLLKRARRTADNLHCPTAFFVQPICCKEDREMGKITLHPTAVKTVEPKDDDREAFSEAAETPQTDRVTEVRVKLRSGAYRVDARRLADKLLRRR